MFAGFSTLYKSAQKAHCRRLATLFPPPPPTSDPTSAPSEVSGTVNESDVGGNDAGFGHSSPPPGPSKHARKDQSEAVKMTCSTITTLDTREVTECVTAQGDAAAVTCSTITALVARKVETECVTV